MPDAPIPAEVLDTAVKDAARVKAKVAREHEPRWASGACACGTPLGDNIDYCWHLINQSFEAALTAVLPRVIAGAEARGKADGWDEGAKAVADEWFDGDGKGIKNPYRKPTS